MNRFKITVYLIWAIFVSALLFSQTFSSTVAHTEEPVSDPDMKSEKRPNDELINRFDAAIQQRFLTEPQFGMYRITPPNPHLTQFTPINSEEKESLADFEKEGWRVTLYLYGKRTTREETNTGGNKKFTVNYRLNRPLPITKGMRYNELVSSSALLKKVKTSFTEFQTPDSPNENNYEFTRGVWFYVARPVRASNQSCLQCHTDYVVAGKSDGKEYTFRKRRLGDANGVLVYGFSKK